MNLYAHVRASLSTESSWPAPPRPNMPPLQGDPITANFPLTLRSHASHFQHATNSVVLIHVKEIVMIIELGKVTAETKQPQNPQAADSIPGEMGLDP